MPENLDGDAAVEFFIVGGIDDAQAALAESALDAKARQTRRFVHPLRGRASLAFSQLAQVQSGLNALARLLSHRGRQLREEIFHLFAGRIRESAQEGVRVRRGIHQSRALSDGAPDFDLDGGLGWRRDQEIAGGIVGAQE